jgi:hypothetical protein
MSDSSDVSEAENVRAKVVEPSCTGAGGAARSRLNMEDVNTDTTPKSQYHDNSIQVENISADTEPAE